MTSSLETHYTGRPMYTYQQNKSCDADQQSHETRHLTKPLGLVYADLASWRGINVNQAANTQVTVLTASQEGAMYGAS